MIKWLTKTKQATVALTINGRVIGYLKQMFAGNDIYEINCTDLVCKECGFRFYGLFDEEGKKSFIKRYRKNHNERSK